MIAFFRDLAGNPQGLTTDPAGWYVLARTETSAEVVHRGTPSALVTMSRKGDRWIMDGYGSSGTEVCRDPRAVLPPGLSTVDWALDPAFPAPTATDTTVHVLVNERACASGQPLGTRLVGPETAVVDGQVLIAFAARPLGEGFHSCQGNLGEPVTVILSAPLGTRALADGTFVPPRPVT